MKNLLQIRIYYEDTDFSGFVYHARYLHFFERARTETLRALGIDQRALFEAEGGSLAFVVRKMEIEFHKPAIMDDMIQVSTQITKIHGASIIMHQKIFRNDELLSEAIVQIIFLSKRKPKRLPQEIKDKLESLI